VRILFCPVIIDDPASLAASPGAIPDELLARLEADELEQSSPVRTLPDAQKRLVAQGRVLARGTHEFAIARHHCEVADQWAFSEVAGLVGASRERLVLADGEQSGVLVDGLARPLVRFDMELRRPFFWFQAGAVETIAHEHEGCAVFLHELRSSVPGEPLHGTVIERFGRGPD
jgi:hypothetical protein